MKGKDDVLKSRWWKKENEGRGGGGCCLYFIFLLKPLWQSRLHREAIRMAIIQFQSLAITVIMSLSETRPEGEDTNSCLVYSSLQSLICQLNERMSVECIVPILPVRPCLMLSCFFLFWFVFFRGGFGGFSSNKLDCRKQSLLRPEIIDFYGHLGAAKTSCVKGR